MLGIGPRDPLSGKGDPAGDASETSPPFLYEGAPPMNLQVGSGPWGRRFTDLSRLPLDARSVDVRHFFVRTDLPASHGRHFPWDIAIEGVEIPFALPFSEIASRSRPVGNFVLECSGNDPGGRFGLLSAADFEGIPFREILSLIRKRTRAPIEPMRILVGGLDDPIRRPEGTGWIFGQDQLVSAGAFLATGMDGKPLLPEHGFPVRLMVPGWYGCACIKWIRRIAFVSENAPATSHMREYAARTHQRGIPNLAREYLPAEAGLASMPVRIERWRTGGKVRYRMVGLIWGGQSAGAQVQIRIGGGHWEDVDVSMRRSTRYGWSIWTRDWAPPAPGEYAVDMRPKDAREPAPRLALGYYRRYFRVDES